jgi:hypothetical protein
MDPTLDDAHFRLPDRRPWQIRWIHESGPIQSRKEYAALYVKRTSSRIISSALFLAA